MLISSDKYKKDSHDNLTLYVFIYTNEIHAVITNSEDQSVEAFDKVDKISNLSILPEKFKDVKVILADQHFTLVPNAIFDKDHIHLYLEFSTMSIEPDAINYTINDRFDLATLWSIDKVIKEQIISYWPGCTIQHISAHLLSNLNENLKNEVIYIYALPGLVAVTLFENGELKLNNLYQAQSGQDALYYSLVALEVTNLSKDDTQAIIHCPTEYEALFKNYFKKASFSSSIKINIENLTKFDLVSCSLV